MLKCWLEAQQAPLKARNVGCADRLADDLAWRYALIAQLLKNKICGGYERRFYSNYMFFIALSIVKRRFFNSKQSLLD